MAAGEGFAFIDIIKIVVAVVLIIALIIPKKKGYEYTKLDKTGFMLNVILSAIYVPMSIAGVFTVFFSDNTSGFSEVKMNLLYVVIMMGSSTPIVSIASIFSSIVLRNRGKSKLSFAVQFLPIALFIIMLITMFVMAYVN
ncbi:MAG: hypothetical protein IJ435_09955 [Clostridia bacterium]|nr:hypothetical protein [Clostridia bacterium]